MVKVIVVDDELRICEGVSRFIDREADGFEVVGSFRDGDEAIAYLQEHDTDIIISDIRMARVSGIELARYVYENKPYIKMAMLSGYQDFEYAQSAISYGVKAYLLKPTDFEELKRTLINLRSQLEQKSDFLEEFMDNAKEMFGLMLRSDWAEGEQLCRKILNGLESVELQRSARHIKDMLEILGDRILANLKIDIRSCGVSIDEIDTAASRTELNSRTLEIFKSIFTLLGKSDSNENTILTKAKKYIDENYTSDLSLQDVADNVYLNPVYFSRFFKIHMGQNFSEYLLDKRMKLAAELLLKNMKISQVSRACGYDNMGYFSRVFKEYYKCTPKEYGRNMNI